MHYTYEHQKLKQQQLQQYVTFHAHSPSPTRQLDAIVRLYEVCLCVSIKSVSGA